MRSWCFLGENTPRDVFSIERFAHRDFLQGSLYYQPKQCTIIQEILQNYQKFALFDSPKWVVFKWLCFQSKNKGSPRTQKQTASWKTRCVREPKANGSNFLFLRRGTPCCSSEPCSKTQALIPSVRTNRILHNMKSLPGIVDGKSYFQTFNFSMGKQSFTLIFHCVPLTFKSFWVLHQSPGINGTQRSAWSICNAL